MKKIFSVIAIVIAAVALLLTILTFYFQTKIKNQIIPQTKEYIKKNSKLDIDFGSARLSLSKLLQFQPALKISKIRIEDAVYIEEATLEFYLKALIKREVKIKEIIIENLLLKLEEDARKQVSLKGVKLPAPEKPTKTKSEISFELIEKLSIDQIQIKDSSLEFLPHKAQTPLLLTNINAKLYDLNIGDQDQGTGKYNFSASLFNSNRSLIKAKGEIGPLDFKLSRIPINGHQSLNLFLEDIPLETRKKTLGELVIVENKSKIEQRADFTGDLSSSIRGNGQVTLNKLVIGKNKKHAININSSLPHSYLYKIPSAVISINSSDAEIKITSQDGQTGILNFNLNLASNMQNQYSNVEITGSLDGLEMREMLNCFTPYQDLISGKFRIDGFRFATQGSDAATLSKNLNGSAKLLIEDGSLYILNSLTRYQDMLGQIFSNADEFTQKLSGKFIKLTTDLNINNQNIYLSNILIDTPKVKITAGGVIDKDKNLDFYSQLSVERLKTPIPILIKGTVEKPRIKPDIKQLGKTQTNNLVDTLLELGLQSLGKKTTAPTPPTSTETSSSQTSSPNGNTTDTSGTSSEITKQQTKELVNTFLNLGLQTLKETAKKNIELKNQSPSTQSSPQQPSTP